MSLVNVWVTDTKAMVVVDTEAQADDGSFFETSKMLTLPHANVVVAGRGINAFMNVLFSLLHMAKAASFDEIDEQMPAALAQATAYLETMPAATFSRSIHEQEVVLVGYSHLLSRVHCSVYQSKDKVGFDAQDIDEAYLSPWTDSWGMPMRVSTSEHARVTSTEQVANALALHPAQPFGGRLLLAEVTRDDCRVSTLARVTSRTAP